MKQDEDQNLMLQVISLLDGRISPENKKQLINKLKERTKPKREVFDCLIELDESRRVRLRYRKANIKHKLSPNCQVTFENGVLKSIDKVFG
jgi:hypothetical protein